MLALCFCLLPGCGKVRGPTGEELGGPGPHQAGSGGGDRGGGGREAAGGNSAAGDAAGGETAGPGAAGGETAEDCEPLAPRLVRLSGLQLTRAIGDLLGEELAQQLRDDFVAAPNPLSFLPLSNEGSVITARTIDVLDGMAREAGEYVLENFEGVTGCGADPTDECVRTFVKDFAVKAFRRSPTDEELDDVLQVYDESRAAEISATPQEAGQYAVYAILSSPLFLYRTEFGGPTGAERELRLTSSEMADALAFFLTGGPPDEGLIADAAADRLSTRAELEPHVDRLLASELTRKNLETALLSYFGGSDVTLANRDPAVYPAWSVALATSMRTEARTFLERTLWSQPLAALLHSRTTRVDASLASLYGVSFPPPGATPDEQGFAEVELPVVRAGLLTQAAPLVARSGSAGLAIGRGTWVNQTFVCEELPSFSMDAFEHGDIISEGHDREATEREQAAHRETTPRCARCHASFDPYGIALGAFDELGAHRSVDDRGRPIDTAVTLPPVFGGVADAAAMAAAIGASDVFVRCLAKNLLAYALADQTPVPLRRDGCEATDIAAAYRAGRDPSFAGLAREVALSRALSVRAAAGEP